MPSIQDLANASMIYDKNNFVSIWDLQKSPWKALKSDNWFKIILKNSKPEFVVFSYEEFEDMMMEWQLSQDEEHLKRIEESRKSKEFVTREEAIKKLNLDI